LVFVGDSRRTVRSTTAILRYGQSHIWTHGAAQRAVCAPFRVCTGDREIAIGVHLRGHLQNALRTNGDTQRAAFAALRIDSILGGHWFKFPFCFGMRMIELQKKYFDDSVTEVCFRPGQRGRADALACFYPHRMRVQHLEGHMRRLGRNLIPDAR
jgi:hypothetical protein